MAKRLSHSESPQYGVHAVDRAVAVLDALADGQLRSQAAIARSTGMSDATVLRYLATLTRHGVVERNSESGAYRLGWRLFGLGEAALAGRDPRDTARPVMQRLLDRFGETVNLAARRDHALVVIEALESSRSLKRGATVGDLDIWHASAVGKSILAHLPEAEVGRVLEAHPAVACTPHTLVTPAAISGELAAIRGAGYAVDDEEGELGLRCIGAPVFDRRGRAEFALSVSGPASRLTNAHVAEIGEAVREAAAEVSAALGHLEARAA